MSDVVDQQASNIPPKPKYKVKPRWKKGESGNPSGRPKGIVCLTSKLRKMLMDDPDNVQQIIDAWTKYAKGGKFPYFKELIDRIDGKQVEKTEVTMERPLVLKVQMPNEQVNDPDDDGDTA
jgi:hypothetical protein